ncbi:2OG-Fe(II) oxygenase superfamily protein [compost metagenome]
MRSTLLSAGEPAPWFTCRTRQREHFCFDSMGGRYLVLSFFGSAADPVSRQLLSDLAAHRAHFRDDHTCFFGVSTDPDDERLERFDHSLRGVRYFWDFDRSVSTLYGVVQADGGIRRVTYVLDPALRVLAAVPVEEPVDNHIPSLIRFLDRLPALDVPHPAPQHAPVLVVPGIFEPSLCKALIDYYETQGGTESGFMVEREGRTVEMADPLHKRRRDCFVEEKALLDGCTRRIHKRLLPEIRKAFQFDATRIERYLVACYDGKEGGHFRAHRDNTTKGTAHRRFAVSLFLNSGYEGGQLRFPEYGGGLYSAPPGGAVVFSCSVLHEATPVTSGRRYMFLPFLYDEAARVIRQENRQYLDA